VNGLTGDLLANVTDTAVQAGGDDVSIDSINVSELPALTDQKNKKPQWQNRMSFVPKAVTCAAAATSAVVDPVSLTCGARPLTNTSVWCCSSWILA